MTNRTPRYDDGTDSDDQIENSAVDALVNLNASDTFSAYPLASTDLATNAVGTGVLDESISPTWSSAHTFNADVSVNGSINEDDIWSSWGEIYPATDSGADQAITDLNAKSSQESLTFPPGSFTVDTPWVHEAGKTIRTKEKSRSGTFLLASSSHPGPMVDIQGAGQCIGMAWSGESNVGPVVTDSNGPGTYGKSHWEHCLVQKPSTNPAWEQVNSPFKWTFIGVEVIDGMHLRAPLQTELIGCTLRAGDYGRALYANAKGGATVIGGNIFASLDDIGVYLDNSSAEIANWEFYDVYVEWNSGGNGTGRAYKIGTAGASNNINGGTIFGGRIKNNNNTDTGSAIEVNATQSFCFSPSSILYAGIIYDVAPSESKFQRGIFNGMVRQETGGQTLSDGFSTEMSIGDVKAYGGAWTT